MDSHIVFLLVLPLCLVEMVCPLSVDILAQQGLHIICVFYSIWLCKICHMFYFRDRRSISQLVLSCRYDFPWTPTKYVPFYGGADYHDYHHYVGGQSHSNFASVFTYCDYIYGTDKVTVIH